MTAVVMTGADAPGLGRPAGEVRQALIAAAERLATPERGATLRELAAAAQVGHLAARWTVKNLRRGGLLVPVRHRRVAYRNRPVAEYVPASVAGENHNNDDAGLQLMRVMQAWG